jgi:outer membrane lipase/esterase
LPVPTHRVQRLLRSARTRQRPAIDAGDTPTNCGLGEMKMKFRIATLLASTVALTAPAVAQSFNQAIIFGDSNVDSGFYKGLPNPGAANPAYNALWAAAVANGAGAPTTNPGLMNSQVLAAYFGLSALPANQPGGTNYATSGAKNVLRNGPNGSETGGFGEAIPTVTQIDHYLAANNGRANSNALYLISSGDNDVAFAFSNIAGHPTDRVAYLVDAANGLSSEIARLKAAGARYIVVPDLDYSFPKNNQARQQAKLAYSQALWSGLAAQGVNFIPADFNAVRLAIDASPGSFGFTSTSNAIGSTACTAPAGVTTAWALLCSSNPNAPSHLVSANADQTFLFADDGHMTTAGQKIAADYFYSLIVAPSAISFLAENPVVSRLGTVAGIQEQIDIARRRPNAGFNVWITGDISSLKMNNSAPGFPGDSSTPISGTAGLDYRWQNGFLLGAAITTGAQTPGFELGGRFKQDEIAGSLYGAYARGPAWVSMIGTYGALRYDVNRVVPIGITLQNNNGSTDGSNVSLAAQGGYDFKTGGLTHSPVIGLTLQQVKVGGFTETGGFTSLAFDAQTRNSAVSALGYKASIDLGVFRPFAQIVWDHELASTDRPIRTSLTTIAAPSYEMPAVQLGKDWATATLGTTVKFTGGLTGLASFTTQIGQTGVTTYGGRIGLNYAID